MTDAQVDQWAALLGEDSDLIKEVRMLRARAKALTEALRELHRRATDPDVRRGVFGALFMLQWAAQAAERALSPRSENERKAT